MSAVQQTARRRFPLAACLILSLSVLLHLVLLRSVTGSRLDAPLAEDVAPVVVTLHPSAPPAAPAAAPPAPRPKPAPRKKTAAPPPEPPSPLPAPLPGEGGGLAAPLPMDDPAPADHKPGLAADTPAADQLVLAPPEENAVPPLQASPPPSALLHYSVDARRSDGNYQGTGSIRFESDGSRYSVQGEVKAIFFSVLSFESSGEVAPQGLAPVLYTEKRFRKASTNTHFQRERQLVSFSASTQSYPRSGLEQDRASIVWQLAALGRGDASQLAPGTELSIFVAGTRDGDTWQMQVTGEEEMMAAGRSLRAVHVLRNPRPGSYEQKLDIWLAPDLQWYPVKLRFTEPNGDQLDPSLTDIPEAISGK